MQSINQLIWICPALNDNQRHLKALCAIREKKTTGLLKQISSDSDQEKTHVGINILAPEGQGSSDDDQLE